MSRGELEIAISNTLYEILEREHLECGVDTFLCGMAVGFDTLAAKVVLTLKLRYPTLRLIAVVPFVGQEVQFSPLDQDIYREILAKADHTFVIEPRGYSAASYHQRNSFLIEFAKKIISYHDGNPRSGTASTLRKAAERGVEVINIFDIV